MIINDTINTHTCVAQNRSDFGATGRAIDFLCGFQVVLCGGPFICIIVPKKLNQFLQQYYMQIACSPFIAHFISLHSHGTSNRFQSMDRSHGTRTSIFLNLDVIYYISLKLNISGSYGLHDSAYVNGYEIIVFSRYEIRKDEVNRIIITGVMNKKQLNPNRFQVAI